MRVDIVGRGLSLSLLILFLFFYITGLKINFFPYYSILPFFIIGFLWFFLYGVKISKSYFIVFLLIFLNIFAYIFSALINQYFEIDYIKQIPLLFIFNFFSAFFFVKLFSNIFFNNKVFLYAIVLAVLFQILLSFIAYLSPTLHSLVFSIVDIGLTADTIEVFNTARVVGVGASFFGSGILTSFTLVFLTVLYKKNYINNDFYYYLLFIIISFFGLMLSRTTSVGITISLLMLIISFNGSKSIKFLFFMMLAVFFGVLLLPFLNVLDDRTLDIFKFGFEFIYDFDNSQAKGSVSEIPKMLRAIPSSFTTWIVGDAKYVDGFGGYYKNIDIGYLRILNATGLIGLFLFVFTHYYLIKNNAIFNGYRAYIFILFLVLNIKGVANLFPLLILLFIFEKESIKSFLFRKCE